MTLVKRKSCCSIIIKFRDQMELFFMLLTKLGEDGKIMHSYEEHWKNCKSVSSF